MLILSTPGWSDYELIDSGEGFRIERFGEYILKRPDPQIIWKYSLSKDKHPKIDASFERISGDRGTWHKYSPIPDKWLMSYQNLKFYAKLSPFKHTGIFPEQSLQWDFIRNVIQKTVGASALGETPEKPNILNLFAYTGLATLAASMAGAKVTHIDASYPSLTWARENAAASGLEKNPIRWIPDDVIKFVSREIKRGVKYDGIIMDPPIYGHGPKGETWKFNESFPKLLTLCKQVLSDKPLFILINAYAISSSALMLENVLKDHLGDLGGKLESGELALKEKSSSRLLSTGIFARWSK